MYRIACALCLVGQTASAVDLYETGLENFIPGADRIAGAPASGSKGAIPGTDGWTGSHAGQDRSGIMAESGHAIPGVGNAAYIGGNSASILSGGGTMYVRKAFNYQPVASGQEVVTVSVLAGIKDSTGLTRDNFEFIIYNYIVLNNGAIQSYPLAGIQFDNSQINPATLKPYQAVYRYSYDSATQSLRYSNTGVTFLYDTLQDLEMRINYRTNRWSASLEGVPLFTDLTFYAGPQALNLGSLVVQCRASVNFAPGTNYMLFDDLSVAANGPLATAPPDLSYQSTSGVQLRWLQEAGYRYQVRFSDGLSAWQVLQASAVAESTGYSGILADASAASARRRFYQVLRTAP